MRITVEHIARGLKPDSTKKDTPKGVPLMYGQLHLMSMRNVGHIVLSLAHILERWGDPEAWKRMDRTIKVVWNPKILATGYTPDAVKRNVLALVDGKWEEVSDEQPGLLRMNYQRVDTGTHDEDDKPAYIGADYRHDLDHDLHLATVGIAKMTAKDNLSHGGEEAYKLVRRYADDINQRLKFVAFGTDRLVREGKRKWYVRGKSLRHPARARHVYHRTEYLDSGDPEQLEAAEFYGKMLASDVDYVQVEGQWVAVAPHYTRALQVARGHSGGSWEAQDITYKREDAPLELFLFRLGDPHVPLGYLAANANTVHMLVMNTGPLGPTISSTVGGNGPKELTNKKVVAYKGKGYPTRRVVLRYPLGTEGVFQISRGLATIYSFAAGNPRYIQQLIELNDRPDSNEHRRFAARAALMQSLTPQRLEVA